MNQPQAAVIEILERRRPSTEDSDGIDVIVPDDIRINGQSLLCPKDHPVEVHPIAISGDSLVLVTLTLIAKRVVIRAEEPDLSTPEGRENTLWGAKK